MTADKQNSLHEFEIIARYFQRSSGDSSVLIDTGDDAALIEPSGPVALSIDTLVEGVHFLPSIAPERLAERALAVNLSDLAAMGAQPRWFTLALTLPHTETDWLQRFAAGLYACATRHDVSLIGGDTTAGPLTITIQIAGVVSLADALQRSGAGPGDAVYVTGTPGDAAAGLECAKRSATLNDDTRYLLDRYELPEPRTAAGVALRGIATAAIDVSDGLVADLGRLCAASGCGAIVEVDQLPLSEPLVRVAGTQRAQELALTGGDDYELCFTASADAQERIVALLSSRGTAVARIGACISGDTVECLQNGEIFTVPEPGYEHFS